MPRILITGGAGFLGSALASCLGQRFAVVLLDSLRRNALGDGGLPAGGQVTLRRGDVQDPDAVAAALSGCSHVVHLASVAGVDDVEAEPVTTLRTAIGGTDNLLRAVVKQGGVERVVIGSSSELYGCHARHPREEDLDVSGAVGEPRWSYAVGKLAAETLAMAYRRQHGVAVSVVRPFNVYGPGQVGQGAVHIFAERALKGLPLCVFNGGEQVRAWCYVDDLVDGLDRVLFSEAAEGEVFNLGNPACALSVRALAAKVLALSGSRSPVVEAARGGPEIHFRVPDISKAARVLGFVPRVGIDEGLLRTLEWYREKYARAERRAEGGRGA